MLRAGASLSTLVRLRGQTLVGLAGVPARGIHPRNKGQRFALDLLADADVPIVALDGPAAAAASRRMVAGLSPGCPPARSQA